MLETNERRLINLVEGDGFRIRHLEGSGKKLVISFASIGRTRLQMPPDEFVGTIARHEDWHGLFVSDLKRSWFNDPDLRDSVQSAVLDLINKHEIESVSTVGVSMGGFCALVASTLFPVDSAIAISPQFTMSREKMRREKRWRYWRKKLPELHYETADAAPYPKHTFVFHGMVDDLSHMRAFPRREGFDHFAFPTLDHSGLAVHLKEKGQLGDLIDACVAVDRRRVASVVRACDGMWRGKFEKSSRAS